MASAVDLLNACCQIIVKLGNCVIHNVCTGAEMEENVIETFRYQRMEFSQVKNPVLGK